MVKRYNSGSPKGGGTTERKGALNPEFALALNKAHGAYYARHGVWLGQEKIGALVGKLLGTAGPSQQKVQMWFAGREPAYLELRALATVLETDTVTLVGAPLGLIFTEGESAGTEEEHQAPEASTVKVQPKPDFPGTGRIGGVKRLPKKPDRSPDVGSGGEDDRAVKKKPMR